MSKVAVLGATGMAGHVVATYMHEMGYEVYEMSRSIPESQKSARIDAVDIATVLRWLDRIGPNYVINALGVLPARAQQRPDLAILLNAYLPRRLEEYYRSSSVKIIHLSTDCVFSGKKGAYTENAFTDGDSVYDRTKALGEIVNVKDLTFRMSIIGPDVDPDGVGLFNWFMQQTGQIRGYSQAWWNGVTTIELSAAIHDAIQQNLCGLYHLVSNEKINKYELLKLFRQEFNRSEVEVVQFADFIVDKTLVNTRTDFDHKVPTYREMVHDMAVWIHSHQQIYSYF